MSARLTLLAVIAACAGCQAPEAPKPATPAPAPHAIVHPPIDLSRAMRQVHFAFRPVAGGFEGGHANYAVDVDATGFSVRPFDLPPSGDVRAAVEGAPVRFGFGQVRRRGATLSVSRPEVEVRKDGTLELSGAGVVEHLENTEAGVEQSWHFESRPDGSGALEVRIPVRGGRFLAADDAGVHFAAGKLGVVYGHATWIDAKGTRREVRATWERGELVLRVPADWVEEASYPAVLDPVIGPELSLGVPAGLSVVSEVDEPAMAFNGSEYQVVWTDVWRGARTLGGCRVSASGEVSTTGNVTGPKADRAPSHPDVAWAWGNFVVIWEDYRAGSADVYGARLTAFGSYADFAVSTAPGRQTRPRIASDGTTALVVWEDERDGGSDIVGARFADGGVRLDTADLAIATAPGDQLAPALSAGASGFLVTWEDDRNSTGQPDIYAARVAADGTVVDPMALQVSTASGAQVRPRLSWNGASWLIVWEDGRSPASAPDVYGAHVTAAGVVEEPAGLQLGTGPGRQAAPSVSWNGAAHAVAWEDERDGGVGLSGALVAADGGAVASPSVDVAPGDVGAARPLIGWGGGDHLLVWQAVRAADAGTEIRGARLGASLAPFDAGVPLQQFGSFRQEGPVASSDGTNYFVAWEERRYNGEFIVATRLAPDGGVLDPSGIVLSTPPVRGLPVPTSPQVTWGSGQYLVVWVEDSDGTGMHIVGARVSADGGALDPQGIHLGPYSGFVGQRPAVASDGTDFLVAWKAWDNDARTQDLRFSRVSAAGITPEPDGVPFMTAFTFWDENPTAVAFGDGVYVVAAKPDGRGLHGARVTPAGTVLDPLGVPLAGNASAVLVAVDGGFILATDEVAMWSLTASALQSVAPISSASGWFPALASDGTSVLAVWREIPSSADNLEGAFLLPTANGWVQGIPFSVTPAAYEVLRPGVASIGPRRFLVTYTRLGVPGDWSTGRVFAKPVTLNTQPVAASQSLTLDEDTSMPITLTATDADGDPLQVWAVVVPPQHGTLSGTSPSLVYTPANDFSGADSFGFVVNDTFEDSTPATIDLQVTPVNDAPVAYPASLTTDLDTPLAIHLVAADVEGDPLMYTVDTQPQQGTLTGTAPDVAYAPTAGFTGTDEFTFRVSDGTASSAQARITIDVRAPGDGGVSPPDGGSSGADGGLTAIDGGLGPAVPGGCGCATPWAGPGAWLLLLLLARRAKRRQ